MEITSSISCSKLLNSTRCLWINPSSSSRSVIFFRILHECEMICALVYPPSSSTFLNRKLRLVVCARNKDGYNESKLVDENMIVLRMRIKDMNISSSEVGQLPSNNWMEWEKKYFSHYNDVVFEVVRVLQMYLMETRPALALGMLTLLSLSVPISTYVLVQHAMEIGKSLL
ncbi:hypothetical protein A4A49_23005 [Nicotiana attenuata]|uniref:Uncharacterized protein n=1 Tax=Nicotiana attenuata TaxID=49451 RepID=A0A1J6L7W5_NICAT|nr:hypothetical protein A4A49_23005 [Nicotiana attenuata]